MKETPTFHGKMRDRISAMGNSSFEMILAINLVEPDSIFRISHSRTSESIELSNFGSISKQMCSCMTSNSSS